MSSSPLRAYLAALARARSTGAATPELAYYPALQTLLNSVGDELRPRVFAVGPLKSTGGGFPDGGLYTSHQLQDGVPLPGVKPIRGAVEVKPPDVPLDRMLNPTTTIGGQVEGYRKHYGGVLVTNYRAFAFIGSHPKVDGVGGGADVREEFELAPSEEAFWAMASNPDAISDEVELDLMEFLARALRFNVPITEPKDLAAILASYARGVRRRLEAADFSRLVSLKEELEKTLDFRFEGEDGRRLFIATIVQTLYYGLFSSYVLWRRAEEYKSGEAVFTWHGAAHYGLAPALQAIFAEVTKPGVVDALDLRKDLGKATATLNLVRHEELFDRFEDQAAIELFYEPFLEAYDPALREAYGVWYTPRPLIDYMVERVDTLLKEELGRPDGLADPDVHVLDPACGTGAYLLAVLRRIERTLLDKKEGLVEAELKRAAMERLHGFEVLTAPFVVAHLMLGLFLREKGAPLGKGERAGVLLTNALAGWTNVNAPKLHLPELADEREAAERVKRDNRIWVVLGNPPYEAFASVAKEGEEERALSAEYRTTTRAPKPKGHGLNDLYVRFYRVAERQIVERAGRGVVCYVTNNSWLDGLSHTGLRERYLRRFSKVWVDNLNGDKYRTGKRTPSGEPDPSVFGLGGNRASIQVGTTIGLFVRKPDEEGTADAPVHYRDLWGRMKLKRLALTSDLEGTEGYERLEPAAALGFPFLPVKVADEYLEWPTLTELFPASFPGVKTSRDEALVDTDLSSLERRMHAYFDPSRSNAEIKGIAPRLMERTKRFDAAGTRRALSKRGINPDGFRRFLYRPFDARWLYWEGETALLDRSRAEYVRHVFEGNVWLAAAQANRRSYDPPVFTTLTGSLHVNERTALYVPLLLAPDVTSGEALRENLSDLAHRYLRDLASNPQDLFYHALAVMHAPQYREENSGALRLDWPRIPLPSDSGLLHRSAELGRRLAGLMDVEHPADGVSNGEVSEALRSIAVPSHVAGRALNPSHDFAMDVGWGRTNKSGAVMPGAGRMHQRPFSYPEQEALAGAADALGGSTLDVYLNGSAYWWNVPAAVWNYTLGGYQVLKKWLSFREAAVLGRPLTLDEVRHFQHSARRIAALLLLERELDESYAAVAAGVEVEA